MRCRRASLHDLYVVDDEAVAMAGLRVVRLSVAATWITLACHEWTELEVVTSGLIERFGLPPVGVDPAERTSAVVATLADYGVLEVSA